MENNSNFGYLLSQVFDRDPTQVVYWPMSPMMHLFPYNNMAPLEKEKKLREINASICVSTCTKIMFHEFTHDVLSFIFSFWVSFDIPVMVLQMLQNLRATPE